MANRLMDIFCADEATNLEEIVESWKLQSRQIFEEMDADGLALESATKILEDLVFLRRMAPVDDHKEEEGEEEEGWE